MFIRINIETRSPSGCPQQLGTGSVLTLAVIAHAEAMSAFRKVVSYVCWCLIVMEVR